MGYLDYGLFRLWVIWTMGKLDLLEKCGLSMHGKVEKIAIDRMMGF